MVLLYKNTNIIAILNFLFPEKRKRKRRKRDECKSNDLYHHLVVSLFHLLLLVVVNFCIIIKCNTLLFFYVILDRLNISNCFRSILRLRDAYFLHYPLYRKCIYSVLAEGSLLQEINKALYFKFKLVSKLLWFVLGLCHPLSRLTLPVFFGLDWSVGLPLV